MNTERTENIFTRSIRKRYGIGMALLLALWPVAGFVPSLESILVNGMLVDSYRQLGFVAFINTLAWFFCISIQRLLNSRIPGVFWTQIVGDGEAPWGIRRVWVTLGLASVTPLVLAFGFGSEFPYEGISHALCAVGATLTGVFSGWIVLLAAGCLKSWLVGSDEDTKNYLPFEARNSPEHPWASKLVSCFAMIAQLPVVRQIKKYTVDVFISIFKLKRIDGQFVIYLTILAVLHWSTARWLSNSESWLTSAPAMVVLLIWIVFMALSGIANGLDRYRVPVVAVVLLLLTVWLSLFGSTRDIRTTKDKSKNQFVAKLAEIGNREIEFLKSGKLGSPNHIALISDETAELEDVAWNAIVNRMQRINPNDDKGKTLVVVTCPGGGIHAAAWSACVLDGLCNDFEEFEDSIGTISGVSGGSVGTLMFVSSRYSDQIEGTQPLATSMPSTEEIHEKMKQSSPALELAARSSLEQIAYGITTDDLYGLVFPPLSLSGRGQRLEDSFSMRMPDSQQEVTLGDWGDMATDGSLPIVIFNSTDAVTGRRILFRPLFRRLAGRPVSVGQAAL